MALGALSLALVARPVVAGIAAPWSPAPPGSPASRASIVPRRAAPPPFTTAVAYPEGSAEETLASLTFGLGAGTAQAGDVALAAPTTSGRAASAPTSSPTPRATLRKAPGKTPRPTPRPTPKPASHVATAVSLAARKLDGPVRAVPGMPAPELGQASTYGPFYRGLIAVPRRGRWLVQIVWHGRYVIRRTNDYGPDRRLFPNRVIDLDVATFEALSGQSWTRGVLWSVRVVYLRYLGA